VKFIRLLKGMMERHRKLRVYRRDSDDLVVEGLTNAADCPGETKMA
jgi:hypothetical protein